MCARYGIPVLHVNSRSPWTLSSEGPTKSSSATGHTATPALLLAYHVFMLDARNCPKLFQQLTRNNNCLHYLIPRTHVIRQLLIVSDLQTNFQLFLQGLISLKICLYATPSPTTNDCDSYFIV